MSAPLYPPRLVDKATAEHLLEMLHTFNDTSQPTEVRIAAGIEVHRIVCGDAPDGLKGGN